MLFVKYKKRTKPISFSFVKGVYAINNHPIVKAEVMGYVVKVERKQMLTVYGGKHDFSAYRNPIRYIYILVNHLPHCGEAIEHVQFSKVGDIAND